MRVRRSLARLYGAVSINVMDCMCEYVFVYALTPSRRIPAASPCSPSLINQPQCQFIHSAAACGHSCVLWMPDGLLRQIFEGRSPPLSPFEAAARQRNYSFSPHCRVKCSSSSRASQNRLSIWFIISLNNSSWQEEKKKLLATPMHLMYIAFTVTFKSPSVISFSRSHPH